MDPVIVFGTTGQVGSVAALTASSLGATVWLAMRNTSKSIPGLSQSSEKESRFQRVYADLEKPSTVSQAIHTSGAKRAFIYLVHHAADHLAGAIKAMKDAGVEFVVFLSSFTIYTTQALRDIDQDDLLPYVHAQVEANLEDVFGADAHVAVRPGCFITNLLSEKEGIVKNDVKMSLQTLIGKIGVLPSSHTDKFKTSKDEKLVHIKIFIASNLYIYSQ